MTSKLLVKATHANTVRAARVDGLRFASGIAARGLSIGRPRSAFKEINWRIFHEDEIEERPRWRHFPGAGRWGRDECVRAAAAPWLGHARRRDQGRDLRRGTDRSDHLSRRRLGR